MLSRVKQLLKRTPVGSLVSWIDRAPTAARVELDRRLSEILFGLEAFVALDIGAGQRSYRERIRGCKLYIRMDVDSRFQCDVAGDACAIPLQNSSCDLVLAIEVLEHIRRPWLAVPELRRVLKPTGVCILSTRFMYPLHGRPGDYWRYSRYALELLFAEFSHTTVYPLGSRAAAVFDFYTGGRNPLRRLSWIPASFRPNDVYASGFLVVARR
jgi:SAM-dependent methyltransferase